MDDGCIYRGVRSGETESLICEASMMQNHPSGEDVGYAGANNIVYRRLGRASWLAIVRFSGIFEYIATGIEKYGFPMSFLEYCSL